MTKIPLKLRLRAALNGLRATFSKPSYVLLAFLVSFTGLGIILWSININTLLSILLDDTINPLNRLTFMLSIYNGLFSSLGFWESLIMLVFSVVFGINISLLSFVLKRKASQLRSQATSTAGLVFAVIGGGCAACGASLLAPVASTIGVTSAYSLQSLSLGVSIVGIALTLWSIILLGNQAATAVKLSQ